MHDLRIGCSGWSYRDWREEFYGGLPPARWLASYASVFDTVEVNATFYRLAREPAVARWAAETPPGFLFTVKASRYLTHVRRLRDLGEPLERFLTPLAPLTAAGKQGPYLWQLPPDFRRDDERLAGLLARLPPGRHAVELRHPSWFCAPVHELLRAHGAALVIGHDPRKVSTPPALTADFTLVRLHFGGGADGDGNYTEDELRAWAARVREWRAAADVFVYLNNDWQGFAPRNAVRLRELAAG
jgi:uncharacterized protein YecE (DUF72 family)